MVPALEVPVVNKFKGVCEYCDMPVRARAGVLFRTTEGTWGVAHTGCAHTGESAVVVCYSPVSGNTWTQNRRGRCEDAPCCGCCTS